MYEKVILQTPKRENAPNLRIWLRPKIRFHSRCQKSTSSKQIQHPFEVRDKQGEK